MKNSIYKIKKNRHFLLFILLFAYVQSIYTRIVGRQQINSYTFTPEAAIATLMGAIILFSIISFFIHKWQKNEAINIKTMLEIFGSSLLVFVISMQLIGFLIALAFGNLERNFNQHTFTISMFSRFLDGIIYGSFFLAYHYYQSNKNYQQKLVSYNKALAESKINQLKTQLNPHFLFNNLNVLDQLIEEDKYKASDFLNEFAEIYRYVIHSTDKDLVQIEDEIDFAEQYFKIIQHKYRSAYQLNIESNNKNGYIVPLTLQLLIENAVQHNLGTKEKPIFIQVKLEENVSVINTINLKRSTKTTSGRALKNLKQQYELLSDTPIEICQMGNCFSVIVPIIQK